MTARTPLGPAVGEPPSRRPASLRSQRLRWTWLLVPPFFLVADPTGLLLLLGFAIATLGLLIRASAAGSILKEQVLATDGPYAVIRHPLYLGSFLVGSGLSVASGQWWVSLLFVVGFLILYGVVVRREEDHLEGLFGENYRRYKKRIPAVVPMPGRRMKGPGDGPGGLRFSLYMRNSEWEAAVGVMAGFALLWLKMSWFG